MGMSADYLEAINHGSTYVRIGSSIFGKRLKKLQFLFFINFTNYPL